MEKDEVKIKKYLLELGFQPNLKGYHLLAALIKKAKEGEKILPLKYYGYVSLSKLFAVSVASIEKDIQNAISIGMLPNLPLETFRYIGNSALVGACEMLLSDEARAEIDELSRGMTYMELSTQPSYMDRFVAACFLPHTDAARFDS